MSGDGKYDVWNIRAGANLVSGHLFKAVTFNGVISSDPYLTAGILRTTASSGGMVSVAYQGVARLSLGADVTTPGYGLTVTTSGYFIPVLGLTVLSTSGTVSGVTSDSPAVARAITAGTSGDLVPAYFSFLTLPVPTIA